jgi:hypothetical protein
MYKCFYKIAAELNDIDECVKVWHIVKSEYATIFRMGRRIWRRTTHPMRLRIFYDFAMLCIRFNQIAHYDTTIRLFAHQLDDENCFDFKVTYRYIISDSNGYCLRC